MYRHESVKHMIGRALKALPASRVIYEPPIEGRPGRYNDIRFEGDPASRIAPADFDISIHTVFGGAELDKLDRIVTADGVSPTDAVMALALKALEGRAVAKRRNQGQVPPRSFVPFVLSPGGLIEESSSLFLDSLKSAMGNTAFDYLLRDLSLALMRSRVDALLG